MTDHRIGAGQTILVFAQLEQPSFQTCAAEKCRGQQDGERHFDDQRNGQVGEHEASQRMFEESVRLTAPFESR